MEVTYDEAFEFIERGGLGSRAQPCSLGLLPRESQPRRRTGHRREGAGQVTNAEAMSLAETALRQRAWRARWEHKPYGRFYEAIEILRRLVPEPAE